jgi:septal ring factor EnvC (AmiA/AmiB activator)
MDESRLYEAMMEVSKELRDFVSEHQKLHQEIAVHQAKVDQVLSDREEEKRQLAELRDWKIEVQGQLKLMKWLSMGGAASAIAFALKLVGVPLP